MSVITVADIRFLPYAGYADPALPDRVWWVNARTTGDVSGSTNLLQLNLKSPATPPGNIFSLEQLSVVASDASTTSVRLTVDGMEFPGPGSLPQGWVIPFSVTDEAGETFTTIVDARPRIRLGRAGNAGTAGTLGFRTLNVSTETVDVFAMGYMWYPRAMNAEGGPRRPASGVFSN